MPTPTDAPPGARESNAGDDFHVLWAVRRALKLIDPLATLRRIVMEGISPLEPKSALPQHFLGVDLTEYYGGDTFADASAVVVSQLKYSTRHPTTAWTVGRLAEGRERSTLRRLSDIMHGFLEAHPREQVLSKLSLHLVSNQPISPPFQQAVQKAQAFLLTKSTATQLATVLKRVTAVEGRLLQRLKEASGLNSVAFVDFLRLLDFSNCGADSRMFQRLGLMRDLGRSVTNDRAATLRGLYALVMHEAQPERSQSTGLVRADVLAALDVVHPEDLFPSPAKFAIPEDLIDSRNAADLAAVLSSGSNQQVLAHGDAGVGKTTTVVSMERHLTAGSKVILYDCFGGSDYLHTGEGRHTPRRFVTQIVNELALSCGIPFLLRPPQETEELWRYFRRSLDAAAQVVSDQGGLLVIAVDAADNATLAARLRATQGFLPDLWMLPLHSNIRLLVTARTHRRSELGTNQAASFELTGFDDVASGKHLRLSFPAATDEDVSAFHHASNHNPRIQSYALDRARHGGGLSDALSAVQRTPAELFDGLVEAAVKHAPQPEQAEDCAATLVCLTRPVRLDIFAEVSGLTQDEALDFCRAFSYGVVIQALTLTFRDEDFETHLRSRLTDAQLTAAHDRLATYFKAREATDPYAASTLAQHLWGSKRYEELVESSLMDTLPAISDAIVRTDVRRSRLLLGLQAAQQLRQSASALKIILILAEASRADDALTSVVQQFPELAARFGDPSGVGRMYLDSHNESWLGPAHMRIAALLAREPAWHVDAQWHQEMARAWMERWSSLGKNERYSWPLSASDIAFCAEAIYRLSGAEAASTFVGSWRPLAFVLSVTEHLAERLVPSLTVDEVREALASLRLPPVWQAPFLAALCRGGQQADKDWVERVAHGLTRSGKRTHRPLYQEEPSRWRLWFCLLCVVKKVDPDLTLQLVSQYQSDELAFGVRLEGGLDRQDENYRLVALEAVLKGVDLTLTDLLPERLKQPKDQHGGDIWEYREVLTSFIPLYSVWAQAAAGRITGAEVEVTLQTQLEQRKSRMHGRRGSRDAQFATWAAVATDTILLVCDASLSLIDDIAALAFEARYSATPSIWIDLAERLTHRADGLPAALQLLQRAASELIARDIPARERWSLLLKCAGIATPFDLDLGEGLYRQGVEAAESLDDDTAILLSTHADVAIRLAPTLTQHDARPLAERLARALETHTPFVGDEDNLPIRLTVEAAMTLDPVSGLALASRWDDEGRASLSELIPTVVETAVGSSVLTPLEGLALLRLAGERYDPTHLGVRWLGQVHAAGRHGNRTLRILSAEISRWICRDIPLEKRGEAAARVVDWASAQGYTDLPGLGELTTMLVFIRSLAPSSPAAPNSYEFTSATEQNDKPVGTESNLLLTHAAKEWRTHFCTEDAERYFVNVRRGLAPQQRLDHLSALISFGDLGAYELPITAILRELQAALSSWRTLPAVQTWAQQNLPPFFQTKLPSLIRFDQRQANLAVIARMPLLDDPLAVMLDGLRIHAEHLDASALYAVLSEAIALLPHAEAHSVLLWSLDRFEQATALPIISIPELPVDMPKALAHFYWSAFGHPDTSVRWRSLHAARSTILGPNSVLLPDLLAVSSLRTAGAFRASSLEFYWLSARAYFSMLLARLANDQSLLLLPHLDAVARLALDQDLPHIQVRAFCQRAVLKVLASQPQASYSELKRRLSELNEPKICVDAEQADNSPEQDDELAWSREHHRFNFDSLDTLPYWYRPLGDVFGISSEEVARQAEVWILDRWNYLDTDTLHDSRRERRRRYEDMSNRHGTLPRYEDLKTYLEFNAMLCVAGNLIDTWCVQRPRYGDEQPGEAWSYWMSHYLDTSPDWWLDDLREPTPLEAELWGISGDLESWLAKPFDAYEQALGSSREPATWLCVHGVTEFRRSDRMGESRIHSALVAPASASSLLRALATAKDSNDYYLPYLGDEGEIEEGVFDLKGWLTSPRRDSKGIDEYDPIRRDLDPRRVKPGQLFINGLYSWPTATEIDFRKADGQVVARHELWNDDLETREEYQTTWGGAGERLWVAVPSLLDFLNHLQRSLIIKVQLRRSQRRSDQRRGWEYDQGTSRIFVLNANGRLETMDRCRDLGRNYRPTTAPGDKR